MLALDELLDGDAAVAEDAGVAVDEGDRRLARAGVHEAVVEGDEAGLRAQLRDVDRRARPRCRGRPGARSRLPPCRSTAGFAFASACSLLGVAARHPRVYRRRPASARLSRAPTRLRAMDFDLSDDQLALRDGARALLDGRSSPARCGRSSTADGGSTATLWAAMVEQGWLGIAVPEARGRARASARSRSRCCSRRSAATSRPAPFASTVLAIDALDAGGRRRAGRAAARRGDAVACVAWSAGADAVTARRRRRVDGLDRPPGPGAVRAVGRRRGGRRDRDRRVRRCSRRPRRGRAPRRASRRWTSPASSAGSPFDGTPGAAARRRRRRRRAPRPRRDLRRRRDARRARPRARAWRSSTPRSGCSSAGRSAASRR